MFTKIKDLYYSFITGIANIINWWPIIWNDRDFDHSYFHIVMLHKLKNMEKFFRSDYVWSADAIERANDIKYAIGLLQRIIDNVYIEEALKPFYEKYPDYEFDLKTEPCPDNPNLNQLIDNDTEDQKDLMLACFKNEEKLREKDYDRFYRFIRKHIQEWWD